MLGTVGVQELGSLATRTSQGFWRILLSGVHSSTEVSEMIAKIADLKIECEYNVNENMYAQNKIIDLCLTWELFHDTCVEICRIKKQNTVLKKAIAVIKKNHATPDLGCVICRAIEETEEVCGD